MSKIYNRTHFFAWNRECKQFLLLHVFVSGEYKKETNLDCNYQPIRNDYRDNGRLFIYIF